MLEKALEIKEAVAAEDRLQLYDETENMVQYSGSDLLNRSGSNLNT